MSMTGAALGGEDVTDQNWLCVTTPLRTLIMSVFPSSVIIFVRGIHVA